MWLRAFIWVLAHKEKDADITSKTKSQPKQKGFRGFLLISHISTKLKKNHTPRPFYSLVVADAQTVINNIIVFC